MTAHRRIQPIPAAYRHPGFFQPGTSAPIRCTARWRLRQRWRIGPTGGWKSTAIVRAFIPLRDSIVESLGLTPPQVTITHVPGSGCYGHNGADDAAFEAALVARAIPGTPILLKWTREDEHAWEPYAPPMAVDLAVTLSGEQISIYSAEVFSGHAPRPSPARTQIRPGRQSCWPTVSWNNRSARNPQRPTWAVKPACTATSNRFMTLPKPD